MKIHAIFLAIILILVLQSCHWSNKNKRELRQEADSTTQTVSVLSGTDSITQIVSALSGTDSTTPIVSDSVQKNVFDDSLAAQMVKDFYTAYLTEMMKDIPEWRLEQIKRRYVKIELLDEIDDCLINGNLNCDPFINAQDWVEGMLKTLKVTKLGSGIYGIRFSNSGIPLVKLLVEKNNNNKYKIANILTINFDCDDESTNNESAEQEELWETDSTTQTVSNPAQMLKDFYTAYLTEKMKGDDSPQGKLRLEQIARRYVEIELFNKINTAMLEYGGYNPFTNGSYYGENWLETLKVTKLRSGIYVVSLGDPNSFDCILKEIVLRVENNNNKFKIAAILPISVFYQSLYREIIEKEALSGTDSTSQTVSDSVQENVFDDSLAAQMLKDFYTAYLIELMYNQGQLELIERRYIEMSLLDKINGNRDLDYDPLIGAPPNIQESWIRTIKVTKREPGIYVVSFVYDFDCTLQEVVLRVEKNNNKYKIADILPLREMYQSTNPEELIGTDGIITRGRYVSDDSTVIIELRKDNNYRVIERGALIDSGIYITSDADNKLHIKMTNFDVLYKNDTTLILKNFSWGGMNRYYHLKPIGEQYIYLIRQKNK